MLPRACAATCAGPVGDLWMLPAAGLRQVRPRVGRAILDLAAELLALVGARPDLAVALTRRRIAIGHALAMHGIVLPAAVVDVGRVEIAVDVDRPVDVHVHVAVAAAPVPAAEHRRGGGHADAEQQALQQGRAVAVARRRRIVGRRIGAVRPLAIDRTRIDRDIDDFRIGRRDHDGAVGAGALARDGLFLAAGEVAGIGRPGAQALDRIGHVLLLGDHGVAHLLHPVEMVAHLHQHLGKGGQRLHAHVPALVLHGGDRRIALERRIGLRPARRIDDLERVARRHQRLRQQRVGIERDGRQHLVEFLGLERLGRVLGLRTAQGSQERCGDRQQQQRPSVHLSRSFPGRPATARRRQLSLQGQSK